MQRIVAVLVVAVLLPQAMRAQRVDWRTTFTLYGDNTEFFTPYRVGETILGGQVASWIDARLSDHATVYAGAFVDRRAGSTQFADSVKPILSFRYHTTHALGVFGTLETVDRHGLLDPLMVTTRELTTPIEYGGQWIEHAGPFHGELWINWQKLNQPGQREQFEAGGVFGVAVDPHLDVNAQQLWYHRGGQLYNPTVVTNNHAEAAGLTLHDSLGWLGRTSLSAWELWSQGHIDPDYPPGRPDGGHGTYLRAGITPHNWAEVFVIHWIGENFDADAGDNNYNSTGFDESYYRAHRVYTEIGLMRRTRIAGDVSFDAEFRLHNIDNDRSIALFNTRWEYSYRLVIRAPLDITLRD